MICKRMAPRAQIARSSSAAPNPNCACRAGEPLWPFGYGLSYTNFRYGSLTLAQESIKAGDPLNVAVNVTNIGPLAGDEVAQLHRWRSAGHRSSFGQR